MAKPLYQKIIESYIPWILLGFLWIGSILDTLDNTISWITPDVTFIGSALIFIVFLLVQFLVPRLRIRWSLGNIQGVIASLGNRPKLLLVGVLLALWSPRIIDAGNIFYQRIYSTIKYNVREFVEEKGYTELSKKVADLDGDGKEEIFVISSESPPSPMATVGDQNLLIFTMDKKPRLIYTERLIDLGIPWAIETVKIKGDKEQQLLAYTYAGNKLYLSFYVYEFVHFGSSEYIAKLYDSGSGEEYNDGYVFSHLYISDNGIPYFSANNRAYEIIWNGDAVIVREIKSFPIPANLKQVHFWFSSDYENVFDKNNIYLKVGEYLQFVHDSKKDDVECDKGFTIYTTGPDYDSFDVVEPISLTIIATQPGAAHILIGCVFPSGSYNFVLKVHN